MLKAFSAFFFFILSFHHCIYSWRYANELAASIWWINQSLPCRINEVQHVKKDKKKQKKPMGFAFAD